MDMDAKGRYSLPGGRLVPVETPTGTVLFQPGAFVLAEPYNLTYAKIQEKELNLRNRLREAQLPPGQEFIAEASSTFFTREMIRDYKLNSRIVLASGQVIFAQETPEVVAQMVNDRTHEGES